MGSKNASSYATLTLGFVELLLYERIEARYPEQVYHNFQKYFSVFFLEDK